MSEKTPQTPTNDGALDLSGLNFGPAWARDSSESKSVKKFKNRGDRANRSESKDRRRGGGGGFRGDKRGGERRGGFKGKGAPRRGERDRRPPRQEVEPPAGFTLQLMPAEENLDLLAKQVIETRRTYSVFDLAKVLLQSRDRFRVIYESAEHKFFRCREDQSIWLTRDEALRHLWKAGWLSQFYDEVKVQGEAPKGSFSSVSRCGISGELLGPPNYHGFQEKLVALHREKFSNMSLEDYKAKIKTDHGEEAVEAWLEKMKLVTKWRVKEVEPKDAAEKDLDQVDASGDEEESSEPVQSSELTTDDPIETSDSPTEESPDDSEIESCDQEQEGSQEEGQEEFLEDARALERHFSENHFNEVFEETSRAWVMGDIQGNLLSPGLLTMLKRGVAEEKRYPGKLMPLVCRQLSGRHVAVFKWEKKLRVGPSRPHAVPPEVSLSERPQSMINHLQDHSGVTLQDFWAAVWPENLDEAAKHDWLQDFQWLLSQGHLILLSDTTVHLAKKESSPTPEDSRKKSAEKDASQKPEQVEQNSGSSESASLEQAQAVAQTQESSEEVTTKTDEVAESVQDIDQSPS